MAESKKAIDHWPVLLLVALVTVIFVLSLVTFSVDQTSCAYVLRFGHPQRTVAPGLGWKLPWPIETTWIRDNRLQTFEGKIGEFEEILTRDAQNIIVTVYICWRIAPGADEQGHDLALRFLRSVGSFEEADKKLTEVMRSDRNIVFGRYELASMVNVDPQKVKLRAIEEEMLALIQPKAKSLFGIEVKYLGIKHLGLPQAVTTKVAERMKADRDKERQRALSEGEREAIRIKGEADRDRTIILAEAEREARITRSRGDAAAAELYKVFEDNPELAVFLRQLDALRKVTDKTTYVVDENTPPFNLLREQAIENLKGTPPPAAPAPGPAPR